MAEDYREQARHRAQKRKGKNKKAKVKLRMGAAAKFILLAVLVCGCLFLYTKFAVKSTTKTVYQGTAEETFSARGIAVFDEEIISSAKKGIAIINYSDGERVLAKTHVATIYSGDIDESKSNTVKQLNEKINYLETSMKNQHASGKNPQSVNSVLSEKMKKISSYGADGNLQSALSESAELKSLISSNNETNLTSQLSSLKTQRDDVERSISGEKEDYISKTAGEIYSGTDGYETVITKETAQNADINVFQNLWNAKPVDYEKSSDIYVCGKIINNYEITVLSVADAKNTEGIEAGDTVYIRLESQRNGKIPAIVDSVSANGNKAVIKLRVTHDVENFLKERKFNFEFIKATYEGLRVPSEAIMNDGEKPYVFVVKDGVVRKRELEIMYSNSDYSIVKEDNSNEKSLLLYDLVVVKTKNISEGMAIGY